MPSLDNTDSAATCGRLPTELYYEVASWLSSPRDVRALAHALTPHPRLGGEADRLDTTHRGAHCFTVAAQGGWAAATAHVAPHIIGTRQAFEHAPVREVVLGHFCWQKDHKKSGAEAFLKGLHTRFPHQPCPSLQLCYEDMQNRRPDLCPITLPDEGWRVWEHAWSRCQHRLWVFPWLEQLQQERPDHSFLAGLRSEWELLCPQDETAGSDLVVWPARLLDICGALRFCDIASIRDATATRLTRIVRPFLYGPAPQHQDDVLPEDLMQACQHMLPFYLRLLREDEQQRQLLQDPAFFFLAGEQWAFSQ